MSHFPIAMPQGVRPWALALAATAVLSLAGCGGDDDVQPVPVPPPVVVTQNTPSTATILAAQASLDGASSPMPTSGVPSPAQIAAQQAVLDVATTTTNDPASQTALDAGSDKLYKSF